MVMHRRNFLSRGAVASLGGSGALGFLGELPRVAAAEAQVLPKGVRLGDGVEPLVRLLEGTPRDRLMEEVAQRIRGGVPYREWLAALLLAGVRNIQPRPVGFKFHAVLVVHSAHLASLNAPDGERWLPLLWAMDQFKSSQARDVEEGNWTMGAVAAMLDAVRGASWDESSARVVELLNAGAGARAVWDGIFSGAAEMLMRKPGIITLHAVTTANALHYAFGQVRDDATRRLLLLQAASFMSLFRQRGEVSGGTDLAVLEPEAGAVKVEDIFATMREDRLRSSRQVLRYLKDGGERGVLVAAAQRQIYLKGTDSHDYKFSSAVFEDSGSVGGEWGERYLAASTHWLKGSGGHDNPLVGRIRGAFS